MVPHPCRVLIYFQKNHFVLVISLSPRSRTSLASLSVNPKHKSWNRYLFFFFFFFLFIFVLRYSTTTTIATWHQKLLKLVYTVKKISKYVSKITEYHSILSVFFLPSNTPLGYMYILETFLQRRSLEIYWRHSLPSRLRQKVGCFHEMKTI